jgi:hypothetical protein
VSSQGRAASSQSMPSERAVRLEDVYTDMALEQAELAGVAVELVRRLKRVTRTKLVKLIYLVDERYFRLYGETVTGLAYRFDKFGPNAEDNAIVKEADLLAGHELLMEHRPWLVGHQYTYTPGSDPRFEVNLSDTAREVIGSIVAEYGRMSREQIVGAAKMTRPFADKPAKGDALRLVALRDDAKRRLAQIGERAKDSRPMRDFDPEND